MEFCPGHKVWYLDTFNIWMYANVYIYIYIYICVCVCVFVGHGLVTNWFVANLLQPTRWQLIKPSTCII
jgi:hypothetical protein